MTYTRVFYLAKVGYGFDRMLYPQSLLPTRPPHAFLTGESNNSTLPKNLNAWSLHFLKNFTINTWRCCASTSCVGAIAKHVGRKSSGNIACCSTMRGDSECNSEQKNIFESNNQPEQQSTGATINQSNNQQPPRWYGDDDGMKTVATWWHGNCGNNDAMTAASMHGDCGTATVDKKGMATVAMTMWWQQHWWMTTAVMMMVTAATTMVWRLWRRNRAAMMQQYGDDATVWGRWHGKCGKDSMVTTAIMAWKMQLWQCSDSSIGNCGYDDTTDTTVWQLQSNGENDEVLVTATVAKIQWHWQWQ